MNIILFGPPGAGKGTQSKYLIKKLKSFQISTGELLRDEIKKKSQIGRAIIDDMNNGKYISDEVVNKLIEYHVFDPSKKNRLIFDGYPRTLAQAKKLNLLLKTSNQEIDLILFLNIDKKTVIKRLEKRKLIEKRTDDNLDTILKRYDTYMETTQPVLNFYSQNPNFKEIDGGQEIGEITSKIDTFINV